MDNFELESILETFQIIVDTREQSTPKARDRYKAFGVPVMRATLDYGDYCGIVTVDGDTLYDTSKRITPCCVIERKMSLDELASCFTRGRDRFQREFERALSNQAKVYLLIEGGSWEAIQKHRYRSRYNPKAFQASLVAWSVRYNMTPVFCRSETSGGLIKEILYRDMKERLQVGTYG